MLFSLFYLSVDVSSIRFYDRIMTFLCKDYSLEFNNSNLPVQYRWDRGVHLFSLKILIHEGGFSLFLAFSVRNHSFRRSEL